MAFVRPASCLVVIVVGNGTSTCRWLLAVIGWQWRVRPASRPIVNVVGNGTLKWDVVSTLFDVTRRGKNPPGHVIVPATCCVNS